jgi:hypothetical protein
MHTRFSIRAKSDLFLSKDCKVIMFQNMPDATNINMSLFMNQSLDCLINSLSYTCMQLLWTVQETIIEDPI